MANVTELRQMQKPSLRKAKLEQQLDDVLHSVKDDASILHEITKTESERDLGVIINKNLKWHEHIQNIVAKANRILGMLKRTFESRDCELWKKLYISLVRPHLEFAVQAWHPNLKCDIAEIEKVQERALRIPYSHKYLNHAERLKSWNITTLEERRKRGDVIQMYKTLNNIEKIDCINPPVIRSSTVENGPAFSTRGHKMKIDRESFSSQLRNDHAASVNVRHNFFRNRVTPLWNALPNQTVLSLSLKKFKVEYDRQFLS